MIWNQLDNNKGCTSNFFVNCTVQKFYSYDSSLLIKKQDRYPIMQCVLNGYIQFYYERTFVKCLPYVFTNPIFQTNMKSERIDKLMLYNGWSGNPQWRTCLWWKLHHLCFKNTKIVSAIIRNGVLDMPGYIFNSIIFCFCGNFLNFLLFNKYVMDPRTNWQINWWTNQLANQWTAYEEASKNETHKAFKLLSILLSIVTLRKKTVWGCN